MENKKKFWTIMIIISCTFWGISGIFAKFIFNLDRSNTPIFVSQIRMIISGLVILFFSWLNKDKPMEIWKTKKSSFTIIMFGLLGLIPVQYCYFEAIKYGDASIATILQFIGPFFILFYLTIVKRQAPRRIEVICTIIAFIGVFILATHGNINHLAITPQVLFWGLLSAIGVATNTLIPKSLIHEFSPTAVTGWGLLIAGVGLFIIHPHVSASILAPQAIVPLLCVLVIGTIIPFQLFTSALRYVKATTASMLDAFEPISATIGSILVFNMHFYLADMIGSVLIILAVILLNWQPKEKIQ